MSVNLFLNYVPNLNAFWEQLTKLKFSCCFSKIYFIKLFRCTRYLLTLLSLSASVTCYHRDYGPVFGAFNPTYVELSTDCKETDNHACLVIPTKKICREKLAQPLSPFVPIPWWYFYCQWVVTQTPRLTLKTSTVNPYYRKTIDELIKYRKSLKKNNMFNI